jgi:hypothetical protein
VIAVIGTPRLRGTGPEADVAGLAAAIAAGAAAAGSRVEFIGKTGDDPAGDAVLLAMARHFVGHVATLRDPARPTPVVLAEDEPIDVDASGSVSDPGTADAAAPQVAASAPEAAAPEGPALEAADVGLALRYLPELAVIVTVHVTPGVIDEAAAASSWAETSLIVVLRPEEHLPEGLPERAVVVAVADDDDIGAGAGSAIGRYAAALDQGEPAAEAFDALVASGAT